MYISTQFKVMDIDKTIERIKGRIELLNLQEEKIKQIKRQWVVNNNQIHYLCTKLEK
jgi:hypothetical protein